MQATLKVSDEINIERVIVSSPSLVCIEPEFFFSRDHIHTNMRKQVSLDTRHDNDWISIMRKEWYMY